MFKKNKIWIILITAVLILCSISFTYWIIARTYQSLCNNLLVIGSLASNSINYNGFSELKGTELDTNLAYYHRCKVQLTVMRAEIPNCRFLYLIGKKSNGSIFFYVDSEPKESKDYSPPGQLYSESPAKIKNVIKTGHADVVRYSDRWGNWVSVFVPLIDHSTGKIIAVLGIDIDSRNWSMTIIKNASLSIGLFLALLAMSLFLILIANSRHKIKVHEKIIEDNEKWLRILFDNSPDPYLIFVDRVIIDCNNAAMDMLEDTKEQIIGKNASDISPTYQPNGVESVVAVDIIMERTLTKGNQIFEWVHRTLSGKNIWVEVSISAINYYSKQGLFVAWRNIAERKAAEAKLVMLNDKLRLSNEAIETNLYQKNSLIEELTHTKQELEQINSEKDKLFSIIAHDLRNPFVALINHSDLLLENFDKIEDKIKLSMIQGMKDASTATHSLLENLLQWSRSQRGMIKFEPEEFNLFIIVHGATDASHLTAKNKNIMLNNNVPLGLYINADKNLITTIVRNLVSNAIKFTPQNGKIEINAQEYNHECVVSISDSGIGIAQSSINSLFNVSAHTSTRGTSGEKGTGLGLILCKEFVEMHRGRIWADSELGKGSTFYFSIPWQL